VSGVSGAGRAALYFWISSGSFADIRCDPRRLIFGEQLGD
jgi:hypothetical protein